MDILNKYSCEGQMNLFDFIERNSTSFCWDDGINEIVEKLKNIAGIYNLEVGKTEFRIWDHVPHLGYRLWLDVRGTKEQLFDEEFQNDVGEIVNYAKSRSIELTPMWGACWFFRDDDIGRLSFSTLFSDQQRRKRK